MSEFDAYTILVAYPAIFIFVFDWTGEGPRWAAKNRSFFPPAEIKARQESRLRPLLLGKYGLLFFALRIIAGPRLFQIVSLGSHSRPWLVLIAAGIAGGLLMLACRRLISLLSARAMSAEKHDYFLRGSLVLWLAVFLVGGFVEELWRVLCILAFQQNGYTAFSANLLTAFCFGIAHVSGIPSRVSPGGVGAEMILGLILGALFIWSDNILVPYLASVIYFISTFLRVRRHFGEMDKRLQVAS